MTPATPPRTSVGLFTRGHALKAAVEFARADTQARPVALGTGRPLIFDVFTREWQIVFEGDPHPYFSLLTGALAPRRYRVAVHGETGTCRWVDDE